MKQVMSLTTNLMNKKNEHILTLYINTNRAILETRGPQALLSPEYQRLCTDFLTEGSIFAYQQPHCNNK